MHLRISFILQLYDDFTGMRLQDNKYHFRVNGRYITPLIKPGGHYVFLDRQDPFPIDVLIESAEYEPCEIQITAQDTQNNSVQQIRLIPNLSYIRAGSKRIEGTSTINNSDIWLVPKHDKPLMTYDGPVVGGIDEVRINLPSTISITNLNLMLINVKTREVELFKAISHQGGDEYRLDHALQGCYVGGEEIIRVYRAHTNDIGKYSIVVEDQDAQLKYDIMCEHQGRWKKLN